jgi:hypothetical protein
MLGRMQGKRFRQFVTLMVFTDCLMLWQERATIVGWFGHLGR